jgi:hypothetical protein
LQAAEGLWTTFWNSYKSIVTPQVALDEFRWYDQRVWPEASPPLRVTPVTPSAGTGSIDMLPSQVSCSITEQTGTRRRWGRFYMPGPTGGAIDPGNGRWTTATVDGIAGWALTLYNGLRATATKPVVYSPRGGVGPPAFPAGDTLPVTYIRVDSIPDIVRSRRQQDAIYRKLFVLA